MGSYLDMSMKWPEQVRHWYVYGSDRGLVQAAVGELRDHLVGNASRVEYVDGTRCTPDQVRGLLHGSATVEGEAPALVVLEHADSLDMSWMLEGSSRDYPAYLLAVGAEEKIDTSLSRYSYFAKRQAGRIVHCKSGDTKRLINWVQRRLNCTQDVASEFVRVSGGDTSWLACELRKLTYLEVGPSLSPSHVHAVTPPTAVGDFVEHLLLHNKREALRSLPTRESAAVVFRRLEQLTIKGAIVYEAQKNVGWSTRLLLSRTGLPSNELAMLRSHVNTFGRHATERRLRALARVSTEAVRGDRQAWQALVALW